MYLTILWYLEPKQYESKETDTESERDFYDAWEYCKDQTRSIEVLYKNDQDQNVLAKVHFRVYDTVSCTQCTLNGIYNYIPLQDKLPEELKEEIKYQVNRDSPEDKARDFLHWMKAAKKEINHLVSKAIYILYLLVYDLLMVSILCRLNFANIGILICLYGRCK